MTITLLVRVKGGPGSGNYGHAGRPGLVGGSGGHMMTLETAIGLYSSTSPINASLRLGRELDVQEQRIVDALDAGMEPLGRGVTLYRGIRPRTSPEATERIYGKRERLSVGDMWEDKAYTSTSESYMTALKFAKGGTVWRINAREGQRVMKLGSASEDVGEHEYLLPRGSTFKLVGRDYDSKHDVVIMDIEIAS